MNIGADYQKIKQNLLSAFDRLKEFKFLPCKVGNEIISEAEIQKHKKSLEDETFTISFCGQINAGKSTLLNYILFDGEEILPSDSTPWTAKLTTIKYGPVNSVNVTFYNQSEWDSIRNLSIEDNETNIKISYFEKYLRAEVDNSAEKGVYDLEFIKGIALIKNLPDFATLENYVAKTGLYTPFVSHVELIVNNDFIKNFVIVDTPGINDINILRSKVTEQWINKSNAVVYLFYAGAPLNIADFDFIDKYLQFIPSEKIVFAINKADTTGEFQRAKNYIESSLKNNKDLKDRHLIDNQEVYPISSLAAILQFKIDHGIELNEEEKFHLIRIERDAKGFIENEGYVQNLTEAIKKNIMQNKGNDILNKAKQTIETICKSKIKEIDHNIAQNQVLIDNINLSKDDLEIKIKEIKLIRDKLTIIIRNNQEIIVNQSKHYENEILKKLIDIKKSINDSYENWLFDNDLSVDRAIKLTGYQLKNFIEKHFREEINNIIPNRIEEDITDLQNKYKREIINILNEDLKNLIDFFLIPTIDLSEILKLANNLISSLDLGSLKESVLGFLWTKKESSKNNFLKSVSEIMQKYTDNVNDEITGIVVKSVKLFLQDTKGGIDRILDTYENDLNRLNGILNKDENTKNKINSIINNLQKELKEFNLNFDKIKQNI